MAVALNLVCAKTLFLFGLIVLNKISSRSLSSDYTSVTAVNTVISNDYDFFGFTAENITSVGLSPVFCCTPCASVYNASPALLWIRLPHSVPFRPRPMRSTLSSFVAFLLLTVESRRGLQFVYFDFNFKLRAFNCYNRFLTLNSRLHIEDWLSLMHFIVFCRVFKQLLTFLSTPCQSLAPAPCL